MRTIRVLTRSSQLALTQATLVKTALEQQHANTRVELCPTHALGDTYRDRWHEFIQTNPAADLSKRKWTFELEEAIATGAYDLAIHSAKDLPLNLRAGTTLLPVLPRADARDVFIGKQFHFADLPPGALIGTDSQRRRAQLLRLRPDLQVVPHDGNVPTRLEKLTSSTTLAGIVLAAAGLQRLGLTCAVSDTFAATDFVPAAHQGTLVAQFQPANAPLLAMLTTLTDAATVATWQAERAALIQLEADCETALGAWARIESQQLHLLVRGLSLDGQQWLDEADSAPIHEAAQLGERVASRLLARGVQAVLRSNSER